MKVADGHSYTAGDPQWVGHTMQELHSALGEPSFSLGKPYRMVGGPDYRIDVYTAPQPARNPVRNVSTQKAAPGSASR